MWKREKGKGEKEEMRFGAHIRAAPARGMIKKEGEQNREYGISRGGGGQNREEERRCKGVR